MAATERLPHHESHVTTGPVRPWGDVVGYAASASAAPRDGRLLPAGVDLDGLCATGGVVSRASTCLPIRETLGWTTDQYRTWPRTTWQRRAAAATTPTDGTRRTVRPVGFGSLV